jgi:hypothetical protein
MSAPQPLHNVFSPRALYVRTRWHLIYRGSSSSLSREALRALQILVKTSARHVTFESLGLGVDDHLLSGEDPRGQERSKGPRGLWGVRTTTRNSTGTCSDDCSCRSHRASCWYRKHASSNESKHKLSVC